MGARKYPDSFICKGCQELIVRKPSPARDNRREYCSRACKLQAWWRTHQKKVYPPTVVTVQKREERKAQSLENRRLRRQESVRKAYERRVQQSLLTAQRVCRICQMTFTKPLLRPGTWDLCPSLECRQKARAQANRRSRDTYGKKPAERARRRGLPYERCGPIAVCTRDRWHCRLCGVATPKRLRGTQDPCAPEVDHIVPLSYPQSPGHVWSNVQCLCRQCNHIKGARIQGQLRIAI